jgi:hypothetical protein
VTDRRYEPFIDMDRATEATRRRVRTAPPAQDRMPAAETPTVALPRQPAADRPMPERSIPEQPIPERPTPEHMLPERPAPQREPPREAIHYATWARPPVQPAPEALPAPHEPAPH